MHQHAQTPSPSCISLAGDASPTERSLTSALIGAVIGAAGAKAAGGSRVAVRNTAAIAGLAAGFATALSATQAQHKGQMEATTEPDGSVKISMPGALLFPLNSADVKAELNDTLESLAREINKYCDVGVKLVGHTDDSGPLHYNMSLSLRRADAVAASLRRVGVSRAIQTQGLGPSKPAYPNTTESNRAANRRVELFVMPPLGA